MKQKKSMLSVIRNYLTGNKALLIVIVLVIVLSAMTDTFMTKTNILNVLRQVCVSAVLSFGFTMILGAGLIDLSVGSILGLSGLLLGYLSVNLNLNVWVSVLLTIAFGALL